MSTLTTGSLFDDDDLPPPARLLETRANAKPATKAQRTFQKLIFSIERERTQLKQWQDYVPRFFAPSPKPSTRCKRNCARVNGQWRC